MKWITSSAWLLTNCPFWTLCSGAIDRDQTAQRLCAFLCVHRRWRQECRNMTDINLSPPDVLKGTPGVNGTIPGQAGTAGGPGGNAAPPQNTGNGIDALNTEEATGGSGGAGGNGAAAAGRAATPVPAAMPRRAARRSTPSRELQVRLRQSVEPAVMPVSQATSRG
jgi:hypothetical protein